VIAYDAQLELYLKHTQCAFLIKHAVLMLNGSKHCVVCLFVLITLCWRQDNRTNDVMLVWQMKQVFRAAKTHRIQEASKALYGNLSTFVTVIKWSRYVLAEGGKAMERISFEKC
jgi:hypothetical protein